MGNINQRAIDGLMDDTALSTPYGKHKPDRREAVALEAKSFYSLWET